MRWRSMNTSHRNPITVFTKTKDVLLCLFPLCSISLKGHLPNTVGWFCRTVLLSLMESGSLVFLHYSVATVWCELTWTACLLQAASVPWPLLQLEKVLQLLNTTKKGVCNFNNLSSWATPSSWYLVYSNQGTFTSCSLTYDITWTVFEYSVQCKNMVHNLCYVLYSKHGYIILWQNYSATSF